MDSPAEQTYFAEMNELPGSRVAASTDRGESSHLFARTMLVIVCATAADLYRTSRFLIGWTRFGMTTPKEGSSFSGEFSFCGDFSFYEEFPI